MTGMFVVGDVLHLSSRVLRAYGCYNVPQKTLMAALLAAIYWTIRGLGTPLRAVVMYWRNF
jgi:hypothetical protein